MGHRLDSLDGLRAIAILWVSLYHYAVFWTPAGRGDNLLPYGDALAWIPLASVGDLGVWLFFIVSGLVIALSLTRSETAGQFALRRLARLWPTMLICATLTFAATSLLGPPELMRSLPEYLISLTFVPPAHVGKVIGAGEMQWLDGAYWSLWVEVRFYAVAALIYFATRWSLLRGWCVFAALCASVHLAGMAGVGPAEAASRLLFAVYQPFFTVGIAFACLMRGEDRTLAWSVIGISVVLALAYTAGAQGWDLTGNATRLCAIAGTFLLAGIAVLWGQGARPLRWPPLTALGRASYGYYLLHQNLGIALLAAVPVGGMMSIGAMLVIQAGLIALALALHSRVEKPLLRALRGWIDGPKPVSNAEGLVRGR